MAALIEDIQLAKLRKLINGQDISFDTHQAGDGQGVHWKHVHLEKRIHNKSGKVRFPLLSQERPSNSGMNERDFRKVSREVKRELKKNPTLVDKLVDTVAEQIDRFSEGKASEDDAKLAAKKLAGYFDLDEKIISALPSKLEEKKLIRYSSLHINPARQDIIEIVQSPDKINIRKASKETIIEHLEKNEKI